MCQLIAEERPTARKAHQCNACLGQIAPGDIYERQRVVDGADAWTWKSHQLCTAVVLHLQRESGGYWGDCEAPDPWEVQWVLDDLIGGLFGTRREDE